MEAYKSMLIERKNAIKLIKALSEALLKDDKKILYLHEVDAPFVLFDKYEFGGKKCLK